LGAGLLLHLRPSKPGRLITLYNLFIRVYALAIRLASLWNKKAAAWVRGRDQLFKKLEAKIRPGDDIIWVHCSSAGEFEQGKPVMEGLKREYAGHKILVTFFSPSGYAVARNYGPADIVSYLPLDTKKRAQRMVELVKPKMVVFIKYEFWYHHLQTIAYHHIPLLLVSAVFRPGQVFFKPHGGFFRGMLHLFRHIFVQDEASLHLLKSIGITQTSISGDTRFDRVSEIAGRFTRIDSIENYINGEPTLVAGSTWSGDETILAQLQEIKPLKLIIAPHEIDHAHISSVRQQFQHAVLHSEMNEKNSAGNINSRTDALIIDNVGMLSRLYHYALITYVGGGFTKSGIHNILEAAVWGKPVIFGPNYSRYREAVEMINAGGAASIKSGSELCELVTSLMSDGKKRSAMSDAAKTYVEKNRGATAKVLQWIQANRLLTS
jgi:3-deoxy-D-manno-octulosonic-acid transferase